LKTIALLASSLVALLALAGCSSGPNGKGTGGAAAGGASSSGKAGGSGGDGGTGGDQGGSAGSDIAGGAAGSGAGGAGGGTNCGSGSLDKQGCSCQDGDAPRQCYPGPAAQAGVGQCTMGTQQCITQGQGEFLTSSWGPCTGFGQPGPETCDDGLDNDCNGVVNDGCQCKDGDVQPCMLAGGPGTQPCQNGKWGICTCIEGSQQNCMTPDGKSGTETCVNGQWGSCNVNIPIVGQPCNPGDVQQPAAGVCPPFGNSPTSVLYCDDSGKWGCFPADDCSPAACKQCLETHCSAEMVNNQSAQCQTQLSKAVSWLEQCGPDRSGYFSNLSNGCASPNAQDLNQCKFQYCIMNGTCSFW
jgi:hypothetical protein